MLSSGLPVRAQLCRAGPLVTLVPTLPSHGTLSLVALQLLQPQLCPQRRGFQATGGCGWQRCVEGEGLCLATPGPVAPALPVLLPCAVFVIAPRLCLPQLTPAVLCSPCTRVACTTPALQLSSSPCETSLRERRCCCRTLVGSLSGCMHVEPCIPLGWGPSCSLTPSPSFLA